MLTIADCVSDLLYQNDVVIVPGLGAFVRTLESASVNVITHQFSLPFASVSFDGDRKEDNDLLVNYLMSANDVSLEESNKLIRLFVDDCLSNLKVGRTINLSGIGTLSLGTGQRIDFEQDCSVNYYPDAFGLCDYSAVPVFQSKTKEEIKTEIAQQQKDKNTPMTVDKKEVHKEDEKPKRRLGWLWILLSVLVLAAALFLLNYFKIIKIDFNKWFGKEEPIVVVTDTIKPIEKPVLLDTIVNDTLKVTDSLVNDTLPVMDSLANDTVSVLTDTLPSQTDLQQESHEEQKPAVETPKEEAKIFIVGGCFSAEENAEKMANSLRNKGFETAFAQQRGKYWDVYYGKYQTMEEAKLALKELKNKDSETKAWIMVGK